MGTLGISETSILLVLIFCAIFACRSGYNARNGYVDSGPQIVTNIGVFFTFVGIAYGLYNFDQNHLQESIPIFLEGMKTAFITSLLGMFTSFFIRLIQSSKAKSAEKNTHDNLASLGGIHAILGRLESSNRETSVERTQKINEVFYVLREIKNFSQNQTSNSLAIQLSLQEIIKCLKNQSTVSLSEDIKKQTATIDAFQASIKNITNNFSTLAKTMESQSDKIDGMTKSLNTLLKDSMDSQNEQLSKMNAVLEKSMQYNEQASNTSQQTLELTQNFYKNAQIQEEKKINSLKENAEQISGMKIAFDDFLSNMAKKNNDAFIEALNESMQKLNSQLEHQFGENFKRFGDSVAKLIEWQEKYREMLLMGITLFENAKKNHESYVNSVTGKVQENLKLAAKNINGFKECVENSIILQEDLKDNINAIKSSMEENAKALKNTGSIAKTVISNAEKSIEKVESMIDNYTKKQDMACSTLFKQIEQLNKETMQQTVKYNRNIDNALENFENTCKKVTANIARTVEGFDADLENEIQKSMNETNGYFKQMTENIGRESKNQVKELAGALGMITNQMTDNYKTLVSKIEAVDKLLLKR